MTRRSAPEERYGDDDGPGPLFGQHEVPDAPETHETPDTLRARFIAFHAENPNVYEAFERFCLEVAQTGTQRIGAKAIWERMRWFSRFETTDPAFMLNNSFTAFFARKFLDDHPELPDFFELRRQQDEEVA